jgi:hypothetical protein
VYGNTFGFREIAATTTTFSAPRFVLALSADWWKSGVPRESRRADKLGTAWSPDGSEIATLDWPSRTVEVMNADGTNVHPVRPGGIQFVPAWQPRDTDAGDDG